MLPSPFRKLMTCGHIYNAERNGELSPDLTPFLGSSRIVTTFDMPGYVDQARNVTYTSHHFWAHFLQWNKLPEHSSRISNVLVVVHHGAGWEVWEGDEHIAKALHCLSQDQTAAFHLCWRMIDIARAFEHNGFVAGRDEQRVAFVEGRLKKRKLPGGATKVWIEPRKGTLDSRKETLIHAPAEPDVQAA